jgi:LCP family protein required for cell wall assembly
MRKSFLNKALCLRIAIIGLVLVFLIVAGVIVLKEWEKNSGRFPEHELKDQTIIHNGIEYELKQNVETFLVIGLDKFDGDTFSDSYNNNEQADFLMLFVFDNDARQCTAIHINRDTMAEINRLGVAGDKIGTVYQQIALAHTYGNDDVSCRNTADSVSSVLMDVRVNHYISVTMDAVPVVNDLVGGTELVILDDFSSIDPAMVKDEIVRLTGEQALKYVRTRQGLEDSSNTTRMKRQQQFVQTVYDQFKLCSEADSEFIVNASLKLADYMVSDRSVTQLQTLAEKFNDYEFLGIQSIKGESVLGKRYMEFYPDQAALKELVINTFYCPKK